MPSNPKSHLKTSTSHPDNLIWLQLVQRVLNKLISMRSCSRANEFIFWWFLYSKIVASVNALIAQTIFNAPNCSAQVPRVCFKVGLMHDASDRGSFETDANQNGYML